MKREELRDRVNKEVAFWKEFFETKEATGKKFTPDIIYEHATFPEYDHFKYTYFIDPTDFLNFLRGMRPISEQELDKMFKAFRAYLKKKDKEQKRAKGRSLTYVRHKILFMMGVMEIIFAQGLLGQGDNARESFRGILERGSKEENAILLAIFSLKRKYLFGLDTQQRPLSNRDIKKIKKILDKKEL